MEGGVRAASWVRVLEWGVGLWSCVVAGTVGDGLGWAGMGSVGSGDEGF